MVDPMSGLRRVGNCYYFDSPLDVCIDASTGAELPQYQRNKVPTIEPVDAELFVEPDTEGGFKIGVRITPVS